MFFSFVFNPIQYSLRSLQFIIQTVKNIKQVYSLTGEYKDAFEHNNMVPFYGGKLTQQTEDVHQDSVPVAALFLFQ